MLAALRRKEYEPVGREKGIELGLNDEEWEYIVDTLDRAPNEYECVVIATLWSERLSRKNTADLFEDLRQCALSSTDSGLVNRCGTLRDGITVDEHYRVYLSMRAGNEEGTQVPWLGSASCGGAAIDELIASGVTPLALSQQIITGVPESGLSQKRVSHLSQGLSKSLNSQQIPIACSDIYFHQTLQENLVYNTVAIGCVDTSRIVSSEQTDRPKDGLLVLFGANSEPSVRPIRPVGSYEATVRTANPYLQAFISDFMENAYKQKLIWGSTCLSEGGILAATIRMLRSGLSGLTINLDSFHTSCAGLEFTSVLFSNTPHRFLAVISKEHHKQLSTMARASSLKMSTVGSVNELSELNLCWDNFIISGIPSKFASEGPPRREVHVNRTAPMVKVKRSVVDSHIGSKEDSSCLEDHWLDLLANSNLCSRYVMGRDFDKFNNSGVQPSFGVGPAIIRLPRISSSRVQSSRVQSFCKGSDSEVNSAVALTVRVCAKFAAQDCYLGTLQAIMMGFLELSAVGAAPKGIGCSFNFGNIQERSIRLQISEAIRAAGDAAEELGLQLLSDELNFSSLLEVDTQPSPVVALVGVLPDVSKQCRSAFDDSGRRVLVFGKPALDATLGEYCHVAQEGQSLSVPEVDMEAQKQLSRLLRQLIDDTLLCSAHSVGVGGLGIALSHCVFGGGEGLVGVDVCLEIPDSEVVSPSVVLFGESGVSCIVSCRPEDELAVRAVAKQVGVAVFGSGSTGNRTLSVSLRGQEYSVLLKSAKNIWTGGLDYIFDKHESEYLFEANVS